MAKLTPNTTYQMLGVTVNEKIIPDGTRWTDSAKAKAAGFSANALYKAQAHGKILKQGPVSVLPPRRARRKSVGTPGTARRPPAAI